MRVLTVAVPLLSALGLMAGEHVGGPSPDQLWESLAAGNHRFASARPLHPHQGLKTRASLTAGQHPGVVILSCSDSRVAPEVVFDRGLGDLFVIRVAGNIPDDNILGSIEYAVEHLGSRLIVVLGHQRCGAVSAAVAGGEAEGHVASILHELAPAVAAAKGMPGDPVENAVRVNVRKVVEAIENAPPILAKLAAEGKIKVVGARYDLQTGRVDRIADPSASHVAKAH